MRTLYQEDFGDGGEMIIRLEEEKDYIDVENLTREAFWNLHVPGCDEHLLIHNMRKAPEFIKELDFVAIVDNEIVGNIVYVKSKVIDNGVEHEVITFGPVSVLPKYQNRGIGSKLINHTIPLVKEMGYKGIIIYGHPEYYKRFGFKVSKDYLITDKEGRYPAALLVFELYPDGMKGVHGVFDEGKVYEVDEKQLREFDKWFEYKEKAHTKTQDLFAEESGVYL